MDEYVKINTIWKRDQSGQIIEGDYATPELAYLADVPWDWTEKVDGTNVRVGWDGHEVIFGGRTANAQMPVKLLEHLRQTFTPEAFRKACIEEGGMVLYGEGFGAGIQSGGNYSPTQTFALFDVQVGRWWLDRANVADVARKLGVPVVPVIEDMTLRNASDLVKNHPPQSSWGDFPMEGLVGRPLVDLFDRKGNRIMAKIKVKDFRR
jgi:hypothetical protein